uniref:Uncharacterized protein n=1 Tax=Octopus bimaculoides TaxID=37653 RepID=A0A0L8GEG8_OCTBM
MSEVGEVAFVGTQKFCLSVSYDTEPCGAIMRSRTMFIISGDMEPITCDSQDASLSTR